MKRDLLASPLCDHPRYTSDAERRYDRWFGEFSEGWPALVPMHLDFVFQGALGVNDLIFLASQTSCTTQPE